jgi:hypothetical protein
MNTIALRCTASLVMEPMAVRAVAALVCTGGCDGSLSVAIIFVSYALHVRYKPYLDPRSSDETSTTSPPHAGSTRDATMRAVATGTKLLYVRNAQTS